METKPPTQSTQSVAFAVNYSLPSVDQFVATDRTPADSRVLTTGNGTNDDASKAISNKEEASAPPQRAQLAEKDMNRAKRVTVVEPTTPTTTTRTRMTTPAKRSSNRDRKPKQKTREKVRVRYDMNHVPVVQRHDRFIAHHRRSQVVSHSHPTKRRALPPRRARAATDQHEHHHDEGDESTCHKCKGEDLPAPFVADSSVVWIPTKRSEWEDCLSEMTAVCTSAALRRHVATQAVASSSTKQFFAPLSQAYIRDRIDIDDPLEGYQIRHRTGGWLQGFIMWTNFTTWSHYFKWDSLDERSGVLANRNSDPTRRVDLDGSLAVALEAEPRSGDPLTTGLVSPSIAEISLLGGIGCGEYLLRMAIDDIKSRGQYKFIVMQATDASKTFYERFGFVRVGAVCRYGVNDARSGGASKRKPGRPVAGSADATMETTEIVGYRHWTYANERNLDTYGGPSYMMALRLPSDDVASIPAECTVCSLEVQKPSVIEQLKAVAVEEKPKIAQLGAASTPFKKASLMLPIPKPVPAASLDVRPSPYPPGVKRRGRPPKWPPSDKPKPAPTSRAVASKKASAIPVKKKTTVKKAPGVYPPGAKRRGRPPKYWPPITNPKKAVAVAKKSAVKRAASRTRKYPVPKPVPALPPVHVAATGQPVKRGPGRPRKYPLPPPQPEPVKRGPGRPRKHPLPTLPSQEPSVKKRGPGRPRKHPLPEPVAAQPAKASRSPKRRKTNATNLEEQREELMAPVSDGERLSFSQKQYQSVWLAVPPTETSTKRKPPRQREAFMGNPNYFRKKRKPRSATDSSSGSNAASSTKPEEAKVSPYPPGAKRRGRPPKKRGRGRPPKAMTTEPQETQVPAAPPVPSSPKRQPKESPSPLVRRSPRRMTDPSSAST